MVVYSLKTSNNCERGITLICSCGSREHQIEMVYFDNDEDRCDLIVQYHLSPRRIFSRVWSAIKYVFGYRSKFGDFGEMLLDIEDTQELVLFLNEWLGKCLPNDRKAINEQT